jgi:predicted DNA binding CopG/RHH family protein
MNKKVIMSTKPIHQHSKNTRVENWVNATGKPNQLTTRDISAPTMKRLTIDVSEALHKSIKSSCAIKGVNMADEIRRILEECFPPLDNNES